MAAGNVRTFVRALVWNWNVPFLKYQKEILCCCA